MTEKGRALIERWALPDHDGLTVAHIEGAVRLGWLTRAEAETLFAEET